MRWQALDAENVEVKHNGSMGSVEELVLTTSTLYYARNQMRGTKGRKGSSKGFQKVRKSSQPRLK